jgi:hypothetical protein
MVIDPFETGCDLRRQTGAVQHHIALRRCENSGKGAYNCASAFALRPPPRGSYGETGGDSETGSCQL